ncbi:hypothetical protein SASPL_149239 [Salvia splendens]|uniref:SKP1-like protein n=1 Tax=Salvia splendens TaxID=180675 RepID=A0A8X8Z519_SALSN|nr:SKP1-like protein 4 [Salvia splendens]KAG6391484.1 hypothetical protein SASPL_149239 [Salvia splendens]
MAASNSKTVTLVSSDEECFDIAESVAAQSITLRNTIEDCDGQIPLFNVTARVLIKVIDYLENHGGGGGDDEKKKKDDELVSGVPVKLLLEYLMAANYLNIDGLIDLVSKKIADSIAACNSVAEMRSLIGTESDFSPAEEANVVMENQWAFFNGN